MLICVEFGQKRNGEGCNNHKGKNEKHICTSLLSEYEKSAVETVAKKWNWCITDRNKSVTHLIVKTTEQDFRLASRTLKYLMAMAMRIWIVSFDWVSASLDAGTLLPEAGFEVTGYILREQTFYELWANEISFVKYPLFSGWHIQIEGTCTFTTQEDIRCLTTLAGASNDHCMCPEYNKSVLVMLHEKNEKPILTAPSHHTFDIVSYMWFFDSISNRNILPLSKYLIFQQKSVKIDKKKTATINPVKRSKTAGHSKKTDDTRNSDDSDSYKPSDCDSDSDSASMSSDLTDNNFNKLTRANHSTGKSEKRGITLPSASHNEKGKVIHDKRHACYFCSIVITNIFRHYRDNHGDELVVKNIIFSEGTKRDRGFEKLRLMGDFNYNCSVLECGTGELILVRRPSKLRVKLFSHDDFLPCRHCLGFFLRTELWRHVRTCKYRDEGAEQSTFAKHQKDGKHLIAPVLYSSL
jgi:hypothetical protein